MRSSARALALLMALVGGTHCMIVGGKFRPVWSPTWSDFVCRDTRPAEIQALRVLTMYESEHALPGISVTAKAVPPRPLRPRQYALQQFTDERGEAVLRLPPGFWKIRTEHGGFRAVERVVKVSADSQCRLTTHTTMTSFVKVQ